MLFTKGIKRIESNYYQENDNLSKINSKDALRFLCEESFIEPTREARAGR